MQNTFRINVDLKKKTYIEEPVVTQNDAITFLISVFDNGNPFSLSEVTTATLAHTRLDGVTVVTEGTKIDDNTIQFILGTEETKVPGRVSATVQLYDADERVSTIRFTYTVLKDPTGNGYIPTEREQTLIETVLGDGPLVIQQAQDAANFANEQGQFAQTQASAASEAATRANEAAQSATNAANEANAAAQSANTAAQSANDAATTANEAAQNANQAATSANEAAVNAATQAQYAQQQGDYAKAQGDAANLAANNANNAANNANNAATNADNAAATAINAANAANTAADNANNATTNANNAAENANTKAANAQAQADYAKAQGDYAKGQGDYAKAQGDYAKAQGDYAKSVADANKTRWLNPVATFADIATMYPTPQHGDTVQTLDDGKIYRYSSGQWVFKEQYTETAIGALVTEMNKQNRQSAVLTHGTQIVNASQNSPLDISIEGRTLVNLLGIQGRTATNATVTLDSAKYYVLVNEDGTNVTVDGVSQTVPHKFTGKSSVSLSWTSGKVALYEVDAAEYNNILTTWAESEVNRRYPYVDSVQHIQNPYILTEGENLLPPFTDSAWSLHPNVKVISPYELKLNATWGNQSTTTEVPVLKNTDYTISFSSITGRIGIIGLDTGTALFPAQTIASRTFNTGSNTKIRIILDNASGTTGVFTWTNPMLTLGNQPKPFVPRNPSYLFAEVKLGALSDKKDILWKDGQDWKVTKWIEKDVVLDGSLEWVFLSDRTNFKHVFARYILPYAMNVRPYELIKYNGLPSRKDYNGGEGAYVGDNNTNVFLAVPDTDTGWGETYTPTNDEVKAYFWGWRMCNGTYGQPYDGTGTKTWYPIGDSDLSRSVTTCPTSAAPTIAEGKIGYYKLSYVRSTPVTEVVTDKVEGDLVVNGATQVEVGSGFTYTEVDGKRTYTKLAPNARYNVTTNILSVIANYDTSLKSVVDSLIAKQSDIASTVSVNVRAIAELYKRVKALGG